MSAWRGSENFNVFDQSAQAVGGAPLELFDGALGALHRGGRLAD